MKKLLYRRLIWLKKEFIWASKLFATSIGLTFVLWLVLLVLSTLVYNSPEPLASTTMDAVYLAMRRVVLLEERVGLWMAIFTLNTAAIIVATTSSALLILTLPLEIVDLKYRMAHPTYEKIAKTIDKAGYILVWKPLFFIFKRLDSGFAESYQSEPPEYTPQGFRNIVYILPHLIPALAAIVNGIIIGMVLSVDIFMGAYDGFLIAGLRGLTVGAFLNFIYFLSFIMPHGIIELYAFLTALALGYRFASICSNEIYERGLLVDNRLEELEKNVKDLAILAKRFLKSRMVLMTLTVIICLLFIAAYIETHITPYIAERVLVFLRGVWAESL